MLDTVEHRITIVLNHFCLHDFFEHSLLLVLMHTVEDRNDGITGTIFIRRRQVLAVEEIAANFGRLGSSLLILVPQWLLFEVNCASFHDG